MFASTTTENKTASKFRRKLAPHLPGQADAPRVLRLRGKCPTSQKTLGEVVSIPEHDVIHVFDHDTMLAVSHAIEDLASEVGQGELIATFQDFDHFLPNKKRYLGLAQDLDAVRVWGAGVPPKGCPNIDFIVTDNSRMMRYWLILFESASDHAVLVCKQINESNDPAQRKFVGFYSFSPYLVQSIRWRFNLISSGLNNVITHWEESFSLPDVKLKDLGPILQATTQATKQAIAKAKQAKAPAAKAKKTKGAAKTKKPAAKKPLRPSAPKKKISKARKPNPARKKAKR